MSNIVRESYFYKMYLYIHNFLTYGYIAEILLVIVLLILIFMLVLIIKDIKIIYYTVTDNLKYIKNYLKEYIIQTYHFLINYFVMVKRYILRYSILLFIIGLVGLALWIGIRYIVEIGKAKAGLT